MTITSGPTARNRYIGFLTASCGNNRAQSIVIIFFVCLVSAADMVGPHLFQEAAAAVVPGFEDVAGFIDCQVEPHQVTAVGVAGVAGVGGGGEATVVVAR